MTPDEYLAKVSRGRKLTKADSEAINALLNDPLDSLHRDCVITRNWIRESFQEARDRAARWTPRPLP